MWNLKRIIYLSILVILATVLHANDDNSKSPSQELGGFLGYTTIIEHNGSRQILVIDEDKTYRFNFSEFEIPEKINQLDISEDLKKRAIDLYHTYTKSFPEVQADIEGYVSNGWFNSLDSMQADQQNILESRHCLDLSIPFNLSGIYTVVNFELKPEIKTRMLDNFSASMFLEDDEFVIVYLSKEEVEKYSILSGMFPFSLFAQSYQEGMEKDAMASLSSELLNNLPEGKEFVYIARKKLANNHGMSRYPIVDSINFMKTDDSRELVSFNFSEEGILESLEAGELGFLQEYLNNELTTPEDLVQYRSEQETGEVKNTNSSELPFDIPNFKTITFYQEDGIQVKTHFDAGVKPGGSYFSPEDYYGQTNLETKVGGLKLNLVTNFDATSIVTPKEVMAEYEVFDQNENVSLKFQWQVQSEGEKSFVFNPDFNNLDNRISVRIGIKW